MAKTKATKATTTTTYTPRKYPAPTPSEAQIQSTILTTLPKYGFMALRLNSGQLKDAYGHMIKLLPAGTPDILVLIPDANSSVLWVEVKSAKGKVSEAQEAMHSLLKEMGHSVIVARSVDEVLDALGVDKDNQEAMMETVRVTRTKQVRLPKDWRIRAVMGDEMFSTPAFSEDDNDDVVNEQVG